MQCRAKQRPHFDWSCLCSNLVWWWFIDNKKLNRAPLMVFGTCGWKGGKSSSMLLALLPPHLPFLLLSFLSPFLHCLSVLLQSIKRGIYNHLVVLAQPLYYKKVLTDFFRVINLDPNTCRCLGLWNPWNLNQVSPPNKKYCSSIPTFT